MPSEERWRRSRTTRSSISDAPPRSSSTRPAATRASRRAPLRGQAQHVAVLGEQHAVGGQPGRGGEPRVLREHPVLAVDGHEVARPHAPQQLHEVVLAAVAGDVDLRRAGVHDVAAEAEEVADQARDGALVAGDGAGGEHDRVARARRRASRCSPTLTIESAESGSPWLPETKTTRAAAGLVRRARAGASRGASGRRSRPRSSATSALSTMRRPRNATGRPAAHGQVGHALHARDRGREAGDEHAPARAREDLLEGGHDVVLAGREPGLLDVRAVGEQREDAAVAPRARAPRRRCAPRAAPGRRS